MKSTSLLHRLASQYFSRRALPYWSILLLDCTTVVVSGILAYTINHGGSQTLSCAAPLLWTMATYMIFYIIGFKLFHTYAGVIRFSSFVDLQKLSMATVFGLILSVIASRLLRNVEFIIPTRISDLVLGALCALAIMITIRIWVKRLYEFTLRSSTSRKAFIYGVKSGGIALAKSINCNNSGFSLRGFVSDAAEMHNKHLMGVPVYTSSEDIPAIMKKHGATYLLVSPLNNEKMRNNDEFTNSLIYAGIKIMMYPGATEWDGKTELEHTSLKEVNIEDLLPRAQIDLNLTAISDMLKGKRILVTGAAGSIGSEIARQVASFAPSNLVLLDQAETPLHDIRLEMAREYPDVNAMTIVADICIPDRIEAIFKTYRPQYVFHAAAYKHVPMMEDNPMEAIRNNVYGTRIVADMAVKYDTDKFVMISTDKAVNPTNVMGCSKRICEIYVQSLGKAIKDGRIAGKTQFVTTRFGNVLGSNGSVIPIFLDQIHRGGPVTVTHPDITRFFMLIPEACKLVLEAGSMGHGGEIFVFDMGKPVKISNLARRMIMLSGADNIEIKYTGLRDGEKLYEEVLNDAEITLPTPHEKIMIAKVREYDYFKIESEIRQLTDDVSKNDDMLIVKGMKTLVPEFKSRHSKYEVLDTKGNEMR